MFILSTYLPNWYLALTMNMLHSIFLGMREPLISEAVSDFQKFINTYVAKPILLRTCLEAGLSSREARLV